MNIPDYTIPQGATVIDALRKLNSTQAFTLFVTDETGKVTGSLTDGDIRRGLIAGYRPEDSVCKVCLKDFRYLDDSRRNPERLRELRELGIRLVPYLSADGKIEKLIDLGKTRGLLPVDAVVMAGGRGERLRPLTDTTPKPLLPLGGKPIMEYNIDRISSYGINNITISLNYLGDRIRDYFGDGSRKGTSIRYVEENIPLGTLGAASNIKHFTEDAVLVMNSDLFTNIDLEEFYIHFRDNKADIAVASIPYNVTVPYAVMQTDDELIRSFEEKPTYTYYSNGGIYLIKKELLDRMKKNTFCDATDFIRDAIEEGRRVTYFPIIGYWIDIGKPEDYKKAQEFIKFMKR